MPQWNIDLGDSILAYLPNVVAFCVIMGIAVFVSRFLWFVFCSLANVMTRLLYRGLVLPGYSKWFYLIFGAGALLPIVYCLPSGVHALQIPIPPEFYVNLPLAFFYFFAASAPLYLTVQTVQAVKASPARNRSERCKVE